MNGIRRLRPGARRSVRRGVVALGVCFVTALWAAVALAAEETDPTRSSADGLPPMRVAPSSPGAAGPLGLDEVLASVERHFPTLLALRREREARVGDLRAARGRFDLALEAEGDWAAEGFYESQSGRVGFDAPTRLWGLRLRGGYRVGQGRVPSYDGGRLTDDGGEVSVGIDLPLLQGGPTDPNRTAIGLADVDLKRVEPAIQIEWLDRVREASTVYWSWVATGKRLAIAERLLAVASERQSQIARRVEQGAEPRIDLSDNERLIVERRAALRGAERDFEQATIRLGLFLRDEAGRPLDRDRTALPADFPPELPLSEAEIERDLVLVEAAHPILADFALQRESLELELKLARNQRLPHLDLRVEGAQDFGDSRAGIDAVGSLSSDSRSSTEIRAGLEFRLPVLQRQARGREVAARARLARLRAREQWAREQVIADARSAWAALGAAYDQTEQARENVRLAVLLRDAEGRRFGLGRSNLIDVNIREVQAATAQRALVDAQANYFRALADYHASVGHGLLTLDETRAEAVRRTPDLLARSEPELEPASDRSLGGR